MDEIEAGATEAAATTDQAAGQVEQSTTTVAGIEVQADSRVAVGVARSDVVEIRIVDTDIVLILADGRRIFIRDGAVQAVIDPNFVVAFADGAEEAGQSLIQSAGSSEIGRVALSGPMGGQEETVVVVQVPVPMPVAPPIPAAAADGGAASGAQSSGSGSGSGVRPWQTWAMIGTPLLGGLLGASGGGGSSGGSTLTTVPTPVIFALTGDNNVTGLERDSGITVSGTAQANATVQVSWGATPAKSTTADASGNWSVLFAPSEVPADGSAVSLSATAIVNGVQSDPASRDVVVDTTGPAAPQINLVSGDDFVGPTDRAGTVTISGTAEANSRITVNFGTVTRFANVDNLGTWSVSVPGSELPNPGTYNVTAVAVDAAGNVGTTGTRVVTVIPSVTVTGNVTAGQVVPNHDLVVDIYHGDGRAEALASGVAVGANGTFSVSGLSLNIGDVVIVRVRSLKPDTTKADYKDEATGADLDLGDAKLMAVSVVTNATTATVANVNPLTTVVALDAGVPFSDTAPPAVLRDTFTISNDKVATSFGFPAGTQLQSITPVATNGGSYNPNDGLTLGETVGAILAAMSGVDSNNQGDVQKTITDLKNGLGLTGGLSNGSLQTLINGAAVADGLTSGNLQDTISNRTQISGNLNGNSVSISAIAGDNVINATEFNGTTTTPASVTFSGTVSAGATSVILSFGDRTFNAVINGTTWTYSASTADLAALDTQGGARDGSKIVSVTAAFPGGVEVSAVRPINVDTAAPSTPGINIGPTQEINNGLTFAEMADGVTVTGFADAGTEITLTWGSLTRRMVATDAGTWSQTFTKSQIPIDSTESTITVVSTDSAGNSRSAFRNVTIENIDPVVFLTDGNPPDTSGAYTRDADGVSTSRNLTFRLSGAGTSEVQLFNDLDGDGELDAGEELGPTVFLSGDSLEDVGTGVVTLNDVAVDVNGRSVFERLSARFISGARTTIMAPQRIEIDTLATTPTVTLAPSSDTGAVSDDNVTNSQTISFNVTGEGGATVVLFNDANNDGEQNAAVLDEEGNVITAGEETLAEVTLSGVRNDDTATGTLTVPNTKAPEGTWSNLKVKLTDTIGNVAYSTANVVVTVDRTGPTEAQTTLTLDAASDTGASNSDGLTADNTPSFTVQSEGGSTVILFNDDNDNGEVDDGEQIGSDVTLTGTRGETASGQIIVETELADKNYDKLKLKVTDIVGNVLTKSVTGFEVDTTGPDAPTVTFKDENDRNGPFSAASRIFVGGTAEANSTVFVSWQGFPETAVAVDGNGNWSLEVNSVDFEPTTFGSVTVTAYAKDSLGNQGASATSDIDIDTVAVVPTVTLAANMDSGSNSTDLVTNLASIDFDVSGEGGATVSLFNDANNNGVQDADEVTLGSTTLDGDRNEDATGTITIGSTVAVDGTSWQNLRVKLVDAIGNVRHSAVTDPEVKITVDRSAPTDAQTTLSLTGGQDAGLTFGLGRTTDTTPTFNFSSEGGSVVRLFNDLDNDGVIDAGEQIGSDVTLSGGRGTTQSGSVTSSILADGLYNRVKLQVTDVVGNVQTKSFANFTIDTTGPAAPTFTARDASNSSTFDRSSTVTISGTAEANTTVQVTWKNLVINNIVVDGNGNWSTTVAAANLPVSVGTIAITAIATDGLGNVGQTGSTNATLTMSSTELAALTVPQFETLTSSELTALTSSAMAGLTTAQLATLDATEIAALGTDISGLPAALAGSISATQAAALTTAQLGAMSAAQAAQFSATAVGALSGTQLLALNSAGLLDDIATTFSLTPAQIAAMGFTNIDTAAEANLFSSVVTSFNNTAALDLTSISSGVSAVIDGVANGASGVTLANLQALNLGVGNSTTTNNGVSGTGLPSTAFIQPTSTNLASIRTGIDNAGENTAWFDSVSELRRLVALADGSGLHLGTISTLQNGATQIGVTTVNGGSTNTTPNITLRNALLVEGKLYYFVDFDGNATVNDRLRYVEWVANFGTGMNGQEFNLTTTNGTYTLRVPGIGRTVGSAFVDTAYSDTDGDLNPNSTTYSDWSAIIDATGLGGGRAGWTNTPVTSSIASNGDYVIQNGTTRNDFNGATWTLVVELVL